MFNKLVNKYKKEGFVSAIKYIFRFIYLKIRPPFQVLISVIKIKTLGKDLSSDSLIEFANKVGDGVIAPLQIKSEIKSLMQVVKDTKPQVYVEIGTASGGTLFLLSRMLPDGAKIFSLDLPRGEFGGGYPTWKIPIFKSFANTTQSIELLRGNSHTQEMLDKLKNILQGNKIDFLFIDGDHTYSGVKQDFEMYSPLVKSGGVIAFHDIAKHPAEKNTQVDVLWNELKQKYKNQEFIENVEQGCAGIGVIWNN